MAKKVKVTLTVELDQEAYDKEHGPESEWWNKYRVPNATPEQVAEKVATYERNYGETGTAESIVDALREGFHDWASKGWLKITVQGHEVCDKCGGVDRHQKWCEAISGPESSTEGKA